MRIINYKKIHSKILKVGDLISFEDGTIALLLKRDKMVLIKYSFGGDWFDVSKSGYEKDMNQGKYKILARKEDWNIVINPDDTY